jgi:signal transduction histidine kinase
MRPVAANFSMLFSSTSSVFSLSRSAIFTTKEKGTGLGLTNTQNIILSHDAGVTAESEEGRGTSFIISFNYA